MWPTLRTGGPVLFGIVILVAFTGFWWFAMWFLLGGRVTWRRLFPSAVATGLCWLGMVAVFSATFSGMVISSYDRYGPVGIVFDLLSYILAVGVVLILGAVVGIMWRDRASRSGQRSGNGGGPGDRRRLNNPRSLQ